MNAPPDALIITRRDIRSVMQLSDYRDAVANANPMTYRGRDGKQYVAVVADDTLRVFALP